jgi:hypothetical protein
LFALDADEQEDAAAAEQDDETEMQQSDCPPPPTIHEDPSLFVDSSSSSRSSASSSSSSSSLQMLLHHPRHVLTSTTRHGFVCVIRNSQFSDAKLPQLVGYEYDEGQTKFDSLMSQPQCSLSRFRSLRCCF